MNKFLLAITFCAITTNVFAQNIFFPSKVGTVLTYVQKDDKGNIENYSRQTITAVEGSGANMTISYRLEIMDKDRNVLSEISAKRIIRNNVMIFDTESLLAGSVRDSKAEIEVTGSPMTLSNNMRPGQSFDDIQMTINVRRGIVRVRAEMNMTNRQCVAIESVRVPAGTFESHKTSYDVAATVMRITTRTRTETWHAPNVGIVKSRVYDNRNRLQNVTELIEIRLPR